MRPLRTLFAGLVMLSVLSSTAVARKISPASSQPQIRIAPPSPYDLDGSLLGAPTPLRAATVNDTTVLGSWTFDASGACVAQGWTSVDMTVPSGDFFHVDDFAGLGGGTFGRLHALDGAQSMWCGARPGDVSPPELCHYASLPGYGNSWDQTFETTQCLPVTGNVTVDYRIAWDSEPSYDWTTLQWDACDDQWQDLYGGEGVYDGYGSEVASHVLPAASHSGQVRFRFRFTSDAAYSDEDGTVDTDGAVILDDITVSDGSGVVLPTETFEAESVGDHTTLSGNWTSSPAQGYGDFAGLYAGLTVVQEDPCIHDISCLWAFISGSTYDYSCGGYSDQKVVPYENSRGQYIHNDIWSPMIPVVGQGDDFDLRFDVYRDLPLNALVFYQWHVRSVVGGCPGPWRNDGNFYNSEQKEWFTQVQSIGGFIEPGATDIQVALGVVDLCQVFCGVYGNGQCHTAAPFFDNVEVYRVDKIGPQWSVDDVNLFQDNFASDGTLTGTVRADAAVDVAPFFSPTIQPGDSVTITVTGGNASISADPYTGVGPAVYCYVSVAPLGQPDKSGAALTDDASRWPVVDSLSTGGAIWYVVRMDSVVDAYGNLVADRYCVDLADNLFTPGDTVSYFFGARTGAPSNVFNYYTRETGATETLTEAAIHAMEFTCLPAGGPARGGDILYVDGADGWGVQPFFDNAFDILGIRDQVDRYDVLAPTLGQSNRLGGRVINVLQQLSLYHVILWNTGDFDVFLLGDGTLPPYQRANDFGMLATWMDNLSADGGVYLSGDNMASFFSAETGPGAASFRSYIGYNLVSASAHTAGFGISPLGIGEAGGCFDHASIPDTLIAYGGCPGINDFDVLEPTGSATAEMSYGGPYNAGSPNAAVIAQTTVNSMGHQATTFLSGFSFHYIRDDRPAGVPDRAHHLYDILACLGHAGSPPTGTGGTPLVSSLRQNYPNPFNPQTTIAFTLAERGPVRLTVYNVAGQRVRTLVDDVRAPGVPYRVTWDGRNEAGQRVSSGVYFYKLVAKGFTDTKKMVVLK